MATIEVTVCQIGGRKVAEYTFDASISIEADSEDKAIDTILTHNMTGVDIAIVLYKDGSLNVPQEDSND